ncbi:MAG TPA: IclR family transcriptional regulator C-terminal domain-containing protein [Streptomyces sp.]|nr:IclR family transcriptional regulator C-terminal domain-containing protein [Streptomyces sp.]
MALKNEPAAPHHLAQNALRVLEIVARHAGITGSGLARLSGLRPERLTALLRMLGREGYVERATDGTYVTGGAFDRLCSARDRDRALREQLRGTLARLRDSVGAAVFLNHYVDGEVTLTQYADGPATPAPHEWVDFRASAHATAAGKTLLRQLDPAARRDHLARHRPARLTSRTITSRRVLLSRLEAQPPTAPSVDLQEYAIGTVCAAVPLAPAPGGGPYRPAGCLALSLPLADAHRLRDAAATLNRHSAPVLLSLSL